MSLHDCEFKLEDLPIVFISYNEPQANDNFAWLQERHFNVQRVDCIKGSDAANKAAAQLINEEYFEARLVQEYSEIIITETGDNIVLEEDEPYSDDEVYATYGLFSYTQTSSSLASQDGDLRALKFNNDGDKLFVLGRSNDGVYEYSLSTPFDV